MAKQNVLAVLLPVALVAWIERNNYRKNYGDDANAIRNSLAEHEWLRDNPVPACPITGEELSEELSRRQKYWDSLQESKAADAPLQRELFAQLYMKDGKFIKPEWSGNAGFRRARNFFDAMVQRRKMIGQPGNEEMTISGLVPIRQVEYKTEVERIIDQQMENEYQGVGTKKMEDLEKLNVAHDLFVKGAREVDIRRLYPSSTGQKLFGICQADCNWSGLEIYNRFQLNKEHPDFIAWGPIRHNELSKLNQRFEAQRKVNENLPLKNDERGLEPITPEEVDAYFRDRTKGVGDGNAPKIMSKKDMEQGAKSHRVKLVGKVFDSVLGNTQQNLAKYIENAEALNTTVELIDGGNGKVAESVLVATKADATLMADLAKAVSQGKGPQLRAALDKITNPSSDNGVPAKDELVASK